MNAESKNKIIIVDGNSLINRAYYAMGALSAGGLNTGGIFGLTNMILRLLEDYNPTHFLVAFDKRGKTFRHQMYGDYKGTRKGMPEELAEQMPVAKEILDLMGIPRAEFGGYEADDIIGTVSKKAAGQGWDVKIFTGDKDALQLVQHGSEVFITIRGVSQTKNYTEAEIQAEFGVDSARLVDYKGLAGDSSDNIPGIPGVGPKTAMGLLAEFNTVEGIIENAAGISRKRISNLVTEYADQALLSKRLATIDCEIPLDYDDEFLKMGEIDAEKIRAKFLELGFKSLTNKLEELLASRGVDASPANPVFDFAHLKPVDAADLDISKTISLAMPSGTDLICLSDGESIVQSVMPLELEGLRPILENPDIKIRTYFAKPIYLYLMEQGVRLKGHVFDCTIAGYMIDPARKNYDIEDLAYENNLPGLENSSPEHLDSGDSADNTISHGSRYIQILEELAKIFEQKLKDEDLQKCFDDIEMPLIEVLADIENYGFRVDTEILKEIGRGLDEKIESLRDSILQMAGEEFNINSPKQVGVVLFENLGLPVIKKTKTGYSTDAKVMDKLLDKHPIVQKILDYRQYSKLKSTYIDGLLKVQKSGRIHTSLIQTVAATGRLSSRDPNLQNIPIRIEEARHIRKAFIADENCKLISADYSQIELRVLAHLCQDPRLIEAFTADEDIHRITASEVFGVELADVTYEQRSAAKEVNFGIVYGMGDFGLSESLKISIAEAKKYIEGYFKTYPLVRDYMDRIVEECKTNGYVQTMLGRKRYIPDINNRNKMIQAAATRMARNTPIQGSAADIIKVAMVNVYKKLQGMKSKILLQVHDELIINADISEIDEVKEILKEGMESAVQISVPLKTETKEGSSWYDSE